MQMQLLWEVWSWVMTNQLASAVVGGVIVLALAAVVRWVRDVRDSHKVYNFLKGSAAKTGHTFRSTEAIASENKLTERRVEYLCSKHRKIRRNGAEKQSWRLVT